MSPPRITLSHHPLPWEWSQHNHVYHLPRWIVDSHTTFYEVNRFRESSFERLIYVCSMYFHELGLCPLYGCQKFQHFFRFRSWLPKISKFFFILFLIKIIFNDLDFLLTLKLGYASTDGQFLINLFSMIHFVHRTHWRRNYCCMWTWNG